MTRQELSELRRREAAKQDRRNSYRAAQRVERDHDRKGEPAVRSQMRRLGFSTRGSGR